MLKYVLALLTLVTVAAMIFFAITPNPSEIVPIKASDKVLHFAEFFIFTLILSITLLHHKIDKFYPYAFSTLLVLAFITEGLQLYSKTRTFSLLDLGADVGGGLLALGIVKASQIWKSSKRSSLA